MLINPETHFCASIRHGLTPRLGSVEAIGEVQVAGRWKERLACRSQYGVVMYRSIARECGSHLKHQQRTSGASGGTGTLESALEAAIQVLVCDVTLDIYCKTVVHSVEGDAVRAFGFHRELGAALSFLISIFNVHTF